MVNDKLESFKVGDKHRPRVTGKKGADAPQQKAAQPEAQTLGFARIEAILDHEDPKQVHKSLTALIDALDKVASGADAQKERAQAKRAKLAIERTLELLTFLFETKNDMLVAIAGNDKPAPAGKGKPRPSAHKGGR